MTSYADRRANQVNLRATAGASPALDAALRDRAVQALGPAAAGLKALFVELPAVALRAVPDAAGGGGSSEDWAEARWLMLWEEGGAQAVRKIVKESAW
jgi:hypothetical protein